MAALNSGFPQPQLFTPPPSQNLALPTAAPVQLPAQAPVQNQSPAQPQASAPSASASSANSQPDHLRYKNRLQEYTQRSGIPLPVYQTINEGLAHLPSFRSSVLVDGACYTSPNTFQARKAAEQDVAKLAMMSIAERIKDEGVPPIQEDTVFCKSILIEYAVKKNMEKPTYNTVATKGLLPAFISSLVFNGVSYTGEVGKNKKEAEQLAARAVIQSLLGDSESGLIMSEIIKSKYKLYASLHKMKDSHDAHAIVPPAIVNLPEASSGMLGPQHEFKKRKPEEPASQATPELPITFVPSVYEQHPDAAVSTPLSIAPTSLGLSTTSLSIPPASLGLSTTSSSVPPTSGILPTSSGIPPTSLRVPTASSIVLTTSSNVLTTSSSVLTTSLGIAPASLGVTSASKKRRKNKKANKNFQNDAEMLVTASAYYLNRPAPGDLVQ